MDVDDHGAASGEAGGGLIKEARDRPPVEARPVHQLGLGEVPGVEPRRLALGPTGDRAAREVQRVRVGGRARRGQRKAQLGTAPPPADVGNQAGRQLGKTARGTRRGVDHVQHADPIFVGDARDPPAVRRQIELVDVPGDRGGEEPVAPGREIEIREALKLGALVGRHIDAFTVTTELRVSVGHRLAPRLRREQGLLAACGVHEPQVALVDGHPLREEDRPVVGRPIEGSVPPALELDHHVIGGEVARIDHPQVQVPPRAARGHVGIAVALVRPRAPHIARLPVGEQRDFAGRHVVAILLEELGASHVLGEHDIAAVGGLIRRPGHGIGEEGELTAVAAG